MWVYKKNSNNICKFITFKSNSNLVGRFLFSSKKLKFFNMNPQFALTCYNSTVKYQMINCRYKHVLPATVKIS